MALQLEVTIEVEPHYEYPRALAFIHATATRHGHGKLASVSALRIDRAVLNDELHTALEAEHHELAEFATAVLGADGMVRPWLITPGYRAGSGVWGSELNEGRILFIFDVRVDEKVRGQGIGTQALQQLLASNHLDAHDFVFAWPSPTGRDAETPEDWARLLTRQVNFFRQNGFRRVGRTSFFGYAPSSDHPSRLLPAADDVAVHRVELPASVPAVRLAAEPGDVVRAQAGQLYMPHIEELLEKRAAASTQFPLHAALAAAGIARSAEGDARAVAAVRAAYATDSASINDIGPDGERPLHLAARGGCAPAVAVLLELGAGADGGLDARNTSAGLSALEAAEFAMIRQREVGIFDPRGMQFPRSARQPWAGHYTGLLLAQKRLLEAAGEVLAENDEEWVRRHQWGCSCGQCAQGWMSLRMRGYLLDAARTQADNTEMAIEFSFTAPRQLLTEVDDGSALEYIPLHLRSQLYKTFVKGFVALLRLVATALEHPTVDRFFHNSQLPLDDPLRAIELQLASAISPFGLPGYTGPVMDHWDVQSLKFLVGKCGSAATALAYALDCVTDVARDGDGPEIHWWSWPGMPEDPETEEDRARWDALPRCANDREFDLVRARFGLAPEQEWGPYGVRRGGFREPLDRRFGLDDSGEDDENKDDDDEHEDDDDMLRAARDDLLAMMFGFNQSTGPSAGTSNRTPMLAPVQAPRVDVNVNKLLRELGGARQAGPAPRSAAPARVQAPARAPAPTFSRAAPVSIFPAPARAALSTRAPAPASSSSRSAPAGPAPATAAAPVGALPVPAPAPGASARATATAPAPARVPTTSSSRSAKTGPAPATATAPVGALPVRAPAPSASARAAATAPAPAPARVPAASSSRSAAPGPARAAAPPTRAPTAPARTAASAAASVPSRARGAASANGGSQGTDDGGPPAKRVRRGGA